MKTISINDNANAVGTTVNQEIWYTEDLRSPGWMQANGNLVQIALNDLGNVIGRDSANDVFSNQWSSLSSGSFVKLDVPKSVFVTVDNARICSVGSDYMILWCKAFASGSKLHEYKLPSAATSGINKVTIEDNMICVGDSGNRVWCARFYAECYEPNWKLLSIQLHTISVGSQCLYGARPGDLHSLCIHNVSTNKEEVVYDGGEKLYVSANRIGYLAALGYDNNVWLDITIQCASTSTYASDEVECNHANTFQSWILNFVGQPVTPTFFTRYGVNNTYLNLHLASLTGSPLLSLVSNTSTYQYNDLTDPDTIGNPSAQLATPVTQAVVDESGLLCTISGNIIRCTSTYLTTGGVLFSISNAISVSLSDGTLCMISTTNVFSCGPATGVSAGTLIQRNTPGKVTEVSHLFGKLCVITDNADLYCTGALRNHPSAKIPWTFKAPNVASVAIGQQSICIARTNQTVSCAADFFSPMWLTMTGSFTKIAMTGGAEYFCGINSLGELYCTTNLVSAFSKYTVTDGYSGLVFNDVYMSKQAHRGNSGDPYYLQKVVTDRNKSSLRLTINDDRDQSFQIWGGSCALGNCAGKGEMKHKFQANGVATFKKGVCIGYACLNESRLKRLLGRI
jgi:hypothetical protein